MKSNVHKIISFSITLSVLGINPASALDSFEYQVYDNEINKLGQYSLETHVNTNLVGKTNPDYIGKVLENHLTHVTFEFARGMNKYWELGSYLQTALGEDGAYHYAGVKLRSKFVLPRPEENSFQFGVNFEVSNVPHEFEEDRWGSEVRPILGYTLARWTLLFNPIIDINLTPQKSSAPDFSPALKTLFDTKSGFAVGVEYYSDFGEVNNLVSSNHAEQYIFATYDLIGGPVELNIGLGTGLNDESNSRVAKAIFGFVF